MKRKILAALLLTGLLLAPTTRSRAQGYIIFDNYTCDNGQGAIINFSADYGGGPVGNGFSAALYYALGTSVTDPGDNPQNVAASLTLLGNSGVNAGYITALGAGYFVGPVVEIPAYTGGPVTFEVVVYNGSSYDDSTLRAKSGSFVESGLATGADPVDSFENMPVFEVPTPEPGATVLAGIGGIALLAGRRFLSARAFVPGTGLFK